MYFLLYLAAGDWLVYSALSLYHPIFLLDSSEFKLNKLLSLLFSTSLYATIAYMFSCFYLKEALSLKRLLKPFFHRYLTTTGILPGI